MNDDIYKLFEIAEEIMSKALEDLQDPDNLELLNYWGEIIDGLYTKGHGDVVTESVVLVRDSLDKFLDNFDLISSNMANSDLDIDDERYKFMEPLCQMLMCIFIDLFQQNTKDSDLTDEQKESIHILTALCINHILSVISDVIKRHTNGLVDEMVNIRLPNIDRLQDKDSAVNFISDIISGKTKTNINITDIGKIFAENENNVIKFINDRLDVLAKKDYKDPVNKLTIRTYKTILYNFERIKEDEDMNTIIYGYPPLIVLSDAMNYLLEQINASENVKIKSLSDRFVQGEYLTCRRFILETWSNNMLKNYELVLEKAKPTQRRTQWLI